MPRSRGQKKVQKPEGLVDKAGGFARDNPVAAGGALVMALTGTLIIANALGLQSGMHPAPLFATRNIDTQPQLQPAETVPVQQMSPLVLDLQLELRNQGLYEGPLDGMNGPATERAIRMAERKLGKLETGEPTEALLAILSLNKSAPTTVPSTTPEPVLGTVPVPRAKPRQQVGTLDNDFGAPPVELPVRDARLANIQRLLADLGYGPLAADGVMGENTSIAIRRFELDRGLPLTGEPSPDVIQRLEKVSGQRISG